MRFLIHLIVVIGFCASAFANPTDLIRAVIRDDAQEVHHLVGQGADPNWIDENGQTLIGRALLGQSYSAAQALAQLPGLDIERRNSAGESALMLAALRGNEAIVQLLIQRGAVIEPPQGWAPLHYAAAGNSLPVLKMLLALHVRVDPVAPNGRTPLMLATIYGGEEIVDALLAAGADVAARTPQGHRAADFARGAGRERLASRLDALLTAPQKR